MNNKMTKREDAQRNQSWHLVKRPEGDLTPDNFELRESEIPQIKDGEFLVRTIYLSLDPTFRLWTREKESYMPSVALGDVMRGFTMGVVEKSLHADFPEDAIVTGVFGWEKYSVSDGSGIVTLVDMDPRLPLSSRFTLFEHIGLTAYFGILDILQPRYGATMVVSGAAGAVGSMAVQIGKIMGCRVVGIAGTDEKCDWLTEELGADAAVNYRHPAFEDELDVACPTGIDTFFDNVGGEILNAVLARINMKARIAISGGISQYSGDDKQPGPSNILSLLYKRARMEGFIVLDYAADQRWWAKAEQDMTTWYLQGRLKYKLDIFESFEAAPNAVCKLFDGSNTGKLLVKVSDEPDRQMSA